MYVEALVGCMQGVLSVEWLQSYVIKDQCIWNMRLPTDVSYFPIVLNSIAN